MASSPWYPESLARNLNRPARVGTDVIDSSINDEMRAEIGHDVSTGGFAG
jgi:hypothetical protein